jgi:hypothetical protein
MQKRFYVICFCLLLTGLAGNTTVSHGASGYRIDVLEQGNPGGWEESLKTFDDETTIAQSETIAMDIWLQEVPEPLITAGFWIAFDSSQMNIISTDVYSEPWDPGMSQTVVNPQGPGSYMVTVGNLSSASPDTEGDIIVANVLFQCTSSDDVTITLTTIPNFDTVVGDSAEVYDAEIASHTVALYPTGGDTTGCDDGITCTRDSSGPEDQCLNIPDDTLCDDGLFCNGTETCDPLSGCQAGSDPCNTQEECDEETDECISIDEPCIPPCDEEPIPPEDNLPLSLRLIPQMHLRSHWMPLPLLMFIFNQDEKTTFDKTTTVRFTSEEIVTTPVTFVLSKKLLYIFSLIRVAKFGSRVLTEVETTVTTNEGSGTETLQIITLPFF